MYPQSGEQVDCNPAPAWRTVLDAIPSVFGRLVYLRSIAEQPDRMIGHTHQQVFSHWLTLGLSEQIGDLQGYLGTTAPAEPPEYRDLLPANAREVERQLFLTDMETLLELLRVEGGIDLAML